MQTIEDKGLRQIYRKYLTVSSRLSLQTEIIALRHQLAVYQRSNKRSAVKPFDRIIWSCLSKYWSGWRDILVFVKPETVINWRRRRFREHWAKLSQKSKTGRPLATKEIRMLIRKMSIANPLWGSPRIIGELKKLGIELAKSTIEKYMVRHKNPVLPQNSSVLKKLTFSSMKC